MSLLLFLPCLACPCCGKADNKPCRHPLHSRDDRFFAEFLEPVYENWPGQVSPECWSLEWIGMFLDLEALASGGLRDWGVTFWGTNSTGIMLVSHVLYCTPKTLMGVLQHKDLYKGGKHSTRSKKKLRGKKEIDSKNYDLFLTMRVNYMEYTISSLTRWVWIACAHLCNSPEIYSLSSSQHDDKVLVMCQIQGLGIRIGKSGTRAFG